VTKRQRRPLTQKFHVLSSLVNGQTWLFVMGWVARGRAPPCCVERVPRILPTVVASRSCYSPARHRRRGRGTGCGRHFLRPFAALPGRAGRTTRSSPTRACCRQASPV